jgi:hypothetical protein
MKKGMGRDTKAERKVYLPIENERKKRALNPCMLTK